MCKKDFIILNTAFVSEVFSQPACLFLSMLLFITELSPRKNPWNLGFETMVGLMVASLSKLEVILTIKGLFWIGVKAIDLDVYLLLLFRVLVI